jgi:membrane glycosyltransferase
VISVLSGQDSGWAPQKRGDDGYSFLTTLRHNLPATMLGFVLTIAAIAISPIYAAWLAPATIGLMLSAPVSYFTAKRSAGLRSKRLGLLASPHDANPPASRTDALRVRPRFADLRPNRLASLLLHPHEQQRRDYLVDPYWPLARSDVHVPLATARARADKAASISEYVDMLSPAEKMALLNSSKDMKMVSIRFAPFRTSSRRGWQTVAAPGAQLLPAETTRSLKARVDPLRRKP